MLSEKAHEWIDCSYGDEIIDYIFCHCGDNLSADEIKDYMVFEAVNELDI